MTTVKQAKAVARRWVIDEAADKAGFSGALFAGSVIRLPNEATLPPTSDVDLTIVLDTTRPPDKIGKFPCRGVVLDVSYMAADAFRSPEAVLGDYHLAGGMALPGIILDPTGTLASLQREVAEHFAQPEWVRRRCAHARDRVLAGLEHIREGAPLHQNVLAWLFPTGVTTHVLLVAGLRSPTIRTRYLAVRDLLADYGRMDAYEPLLELLGCAGMRQSRAAHHLVALIGAFDAASAIGNTAFPFSSDISDTGRSIAIDGTRDLIERGNHREAIFWVVATYSRCQAILDRDAPARRERFDEGYHELLADLGIASLEDLQLRAERTRTALPWIMDVAETIIAANPTSGNG